VKRILLLLALCIVGGWLFLRQERPKPPVWQPVADGVEWRKMQIKNAGFLNADVEVLVLRLNPSHLHVAAGKLQTAEQWRQSTDSLAVVNGGFFDEKNHSLGLRRAGGKKLTSLRHADWGVFYIKNGKAHLLHTRDFQKINKDGISEAVQCGPRLVVDGHPTDLKDQWARRTGVGIDANGKVLIAVSDNELSLRQWADFWASPQGLHCQQALNLDGGGSTQLALDSNSVNANVGGSWPVPDVLLVR